jgi:hypothetical protein
MPELDLRPLSLGEILDRTFTLYRRNFLLFFGITARVSKNSANCRLDSGRDFW